MDSQLQVTIDHLTAKIASKEDEANKLKRLVNELAAEGGLQIPFPGLVDSVHAVSQIRSDQFYGQPLASAMRNYLEMRKGGNMGAASVSDIYSAVKKGGFKFDTKIEGNAVNTIRMSLRKNSSVFHKLPNGEYGLLSWYPNAKPVKQDDDEDSLPKSTSKAKVKSAEDSEEQPADEVNYLKNNQLRDMVFSLSGEFRSSDLESALANKYPGMKWRPTAISTLLFTLTKKGLIRMASPRRGNLGATYIKA